jgi:hypothetical protein
MPIYFKGMLGMGPDSLPRWLYHKFYEPKLVTNTAEQDKAIAQGYHEPQLDVFTPAAIKDFGTDFEDLNARQIIDFARHKFDIDLSNVTDKNKLIRVINRLYLGCPDDERNVILLAQSMEMNYDETVRLIKDWSLKPNDVTTEVVYI